MSQRQKVGHPRPCQLLHPLTTPRPLPFQTSGDEHYCHFKWLGTNCILTKARHLRDFLASSTLWLGLCIHKGSIFWVRRPLLGRFSKERGGALDHYLDIYEVLEKLGL